MRRYWPEMGGALIGIALGVVLLACLLMMIGCAKEPEPQQTAKTIVWYEVHWRGCAESGSRGFRVESHSVTIAPDGSYEIGAGLDGIYMTHADALYIVESRNRGLWFRSGGGDD